MSKSDEHVRLSYPLAESLPGEIRARSGKPLAELTMAQLCQGQLSPEDLAISAQTLSWQADIAAAHGFTQFAANLRRASELTRVPNGKLLALYEALRPRRSTRAELLTLAEELQIRYDAAHTAALVVEAAEVYEKYGLCRRG